jgi:hypothetical protein
MAPLDGFVAREWAKHCRNATPSSCRAAMYGVVSRSYPYIDVWSARTLSSVIQRMFGASIERTGTYRPISFLVAVRRLRIAERFEFRLRFGVD